MTGASGTDVAIIGAGVAGLTAAAYLARAGLSVDCFEQHERPGGYISSFKRRGFTFPAGPTSFESNGIVRPILRDLGVETRCELAPAGHQLSWDGDATGHDGCSAHDIPLRSPRQVGEALAEAFPHERQGLRRLFRLVDAGSRAMQDMAASGLFFGGGAAGEADADGGARSQGAHRGKLALLRQGVALVLRNPLFPWVMSVIGGTTNHTLYGRYLRDPRLLRMLGGLGYPVMSGQTTLGMWSTFVSVSQEYAVPVGGMQVFADALAGCVEAHGGRLHLGAAVERVLLRDQAVAGVRLADGTEVGARFVVSACDLRHTLLRLVGREHLSPGLAGRVEQATPSESLFAVYLGLDDSPEMAAALHRFRESHVCYSGPRGELLHAALLTKDDPTLAPPGHHALWLGRFSAYEEWAGLDAAAYRQRKEDEAERLIRTAGLLVPGLRSHVVVTETATPLTYERYTGNWRGASAGWSWDPTRDPKLKLAAERLPQNLFLAGHWTFAPGGVPSAMITAWYAAQEIVRRAR